MSEEKMKLLALDSKERITTFQSGDKVYRHIFRRLTEKDWGEYFSHIIIESQNERGGETRIIDVNSASLHFYAKAIERVEGYSTRDGSDPKNLPSWPECIPQNHRLHAVDVLTNVNVEDAADESILEAETISVNLSATWGSDEGMLQFSGLVHKFKIPNADHRRRIMKARNRSFIAGGSRKGVSTSISAHPVLLKLYDELIESVDGYSIAGMPLRGSQEIAREMDAYHKTTAVGALFAVGYRDAEEQAA